MVFGADEQQKHVSLCQVPCDALVVNLDYDELVWSRERTPLPSLPDCPHISST